MYEPIRACNRRMTQKPPHLSLLLYLGDTGTQIMTEKGYIRRFSLSNFRLGCEGESFVANVASHIEEKIWRTPFLRRVMGSPACTKKHDWSLSIPFRRPAAIPVNICSLRSTAGDDSITSVACPCCKVDKKDLLCCFEEKCSLHRDYRSERTIKCVTQHRQITAYKMLLYAA